MLLIGGSKDKDHGDILKASLMAKDFFRKVNEDRDLIGFIVGDVKKNTQENVWKVMCGFFPTIGSQIRVFYLVKVDVAENRIISVEEIKPNKTKL